MEARADCSLKDYEITSKDRAQLEDSKNGAQQQPHITCSLGKHPVTGFAYCYGNTINDKVHPSSLTSSAEGLQCTTCFVVVLSSTLATGILSTWPRHLCRLSNNTAGSYPRPAPGSLAVYHFIKAGRQPSKDLTGILSKHIGF